MLNHDVKEVSKVTTSHNKIASYKTTSEMKTSFLTTCGYFIIPKRICVFKYNVECFCKLLPKLL